MRIHLEYCLKLSIFEHYDTYKFYLNLIKEKWE